MKCTVAFNKRYDRISNSVTYETIFNDYDTKNDCRNLDYQLAYLAKEMFKRYFKEDDMLHQVYRCFLSYISNNPSVISDSFNFQFYVFLKFHILEQEVPLCSVSETAKFFEIYKNVIQNKKTVQSVNLNLSRKVLFCNALFEIYKILDLSQFNNPFIDHFLNCPFQKDKVYFKEYDAYERVKDIFTIFEIKQT